MTQRILSASYLRPSASKTARLKAAAAKAESTASRCVARCVKLRRRNRSARSVHRERPHTPVSRRDRCTANVQLQRAGPNTLMLLAGQTPERWLVGIRRFYLRGDGVGEEG